MASPSAFQGVPSEDKNAEFERAALRNVVRREYQRQIQKPGFTGVMLDPAVQRWNYARVNAHQFFKATPKTSFLGIFIGIGPPIVFMLWINHRRDVREAAYKAGTAKPPRNIKG